MKFARFFSPSVFSALIALSLEPLPLRAGLPIIFDLDMCAGYSKEIVHGYLSESGNLVAHDFIKGELPTNTIAVANGPQIYQKLLEAMKNESQPATNYIEVVAFLKGQEIGR